jgi:hypothetical protein
MTSRARVLQRKKKPPQRGCHFNRGIDVKRRRTEIRSPFWVQFQKSARANAIYNGEKPFAVLTRKVIKAEMKARTPSQAGNLLSALRGMIRWMIDEGHLDEDDDPTIGVRSGKARRHARAAGSSPGPRTTWRDTGRSGRSVPRRG